MGDELDQEIIDACAEIKEGCGFSLSLQVELKLKKKNEPRYFCLGKHKFYLVKIVKKRPEVTHEVHFLTIKQIEITDPTELSFEIENPYPSIGAAVAMEFSLKSTEPEKIVNFIRKKVHYCFPGKAEKLINWKYPDYVRMEDLPPAGDPCLNFSAGYLCACSLEGIPPRADVVWDVDNLFPYNTITEFSFHEFETPITVQDMKTILLAVTHNNYFTSLYIDNDEEFRVDKHFSLVVCLAKWNTSLKKIRFHNLETTTNDWVNFFQALKANTSSNIGSVELMYCNLDAQGRIYTALSEWEQRLALSRGISDLIINVPVNTSLNKKFTSILEGMKDNPHTATTLQKVDLKGVKFEKSSSEHLAQFLAEKNNIKALNLSDTGIHLPTLFEAIAQGNSQALRILNISGNQLPKKFEESQVKCIIDYFAEQVTEELDISSTLFPFPFLEKVITALYKNQNIKTLKLIAANNSLGKDGVSSLFPESFPPEKVRNLTYLDVRDNELSEEGITAIAAKVGGLPALTELDLSFNFKTISKETKARDDAMEALAEVIQRSASLATLRLQGRKGFTAGPSINIMLIPLGSEGVLRQLDISGNAMNDIGTIALCKALQTNECLRSISIDRNGLNLRCLQWLKLSLERNFTLTHVEPPSSDMELERNEERRLKMWSVFSDISKILIKNQERREKKPMATVMTSTATTTSSALPVLTTRRSSRLITPQNTNNNNNNNSSTTTTTTTTLTTSTGTTATSGTSSSAKRNPGLSRTATEADTPEQRLQQTIAQAKSLYSKNKLPEELSQLIEESQSLLSQLPTQLHAVQNSALEDFDPKFNSQIQVHSTMCTTFKSKIKELVEEKYKALDNEQKNGLMIIVSSSLQSSDSIQKFFQQNISQLKEDTSSLFTETQNLATNFLVEKFADKLDIYIKKKEEEDDEQSTEKSSGGRTMIKTGKKKSTTRKSASSSSSSNPIKQIKSPRKTKSSTGKEKPKSFRPRPGSQVISSPLDVLGGNPQQEELVVNDD